MNDLNLKTVKKKRGGNCQKLHKYLNIQNHQHYSFEIIHKSKNVFIENKPDNVEAVKTYLSKQNKMLHDKSIAPLADKVQTSKKGT